MDDKVATFVSFTGAAPEQAAIFVEMANGDVEAAVELFFSQGDGDVPMAGPGGDAALAQDAAMPPAQVEGPPWWGIIWPTSEPPPEAWTLQRLDVPGADWKGGILQPKNGPCGILAVLHAYIIAEQHSADVEEIVVTPEATAQVITQILLRCRPDAAAPVRLVRPKERGNYQPGAGVEETEVAEEGALAAEVLGRIEGFRGPGGIIDLMYSAVLTRGVDQVKKEATSEGGELPLVTKAFNCWLCTTELLSLLMRGCAVGNVGSFRADGSKNESWEGSLIGILSTGEKDSNIPVADALKGPQRPVWILHGGDHFTVAWSKAMPPMDKGAEFTLYHWNGLPPGGPRLAELSVTAVNGTRSTPVGVPKFYKPEPGEVDEVVQADPEDRKKYPNEYRRWHFEVLLAWDDPDLQGEPRPADAPAQPKVDQEDPRYQREGPWRCRLCYARRFQTMDFSLVPADSPNSCPKCQKPRKECGWAIWMPFADLPPNRQGTVMDRHASKMEPILWTRWPRAEVSVASGAFPDC